MARRGKCAGLIRATLLLATAALVFGLPMQAQGNPAAPPDSDAKATAGTQQPPQPAAPEAKSEPAPAEGNPPAAASPVLSREDQIAAETKELYRLSAELRAEVAKTYKGTLSLAVLKKAEQIEKLAKSLKTLMTAEAADNKHKNQ